MTKVKAVDVSRPPVNGHEPVSAVSVAAYVE